MTYHERRLNYVGIGPSAGNVIRAAAAFHWRHCWARNCRPSACDRRLAVVRHCNGDAFAASNSASYVILTSVSTKLQVAVPGGLRETAKRRRRHIEGIDPGPASGGFDAGCLRLLCEGQQLADWVYQDLINAMLERLEPLLLARIHQVNAYPGVPDCIIVGVLKERGYELSGEDRTLAHADDGPGQSATPARFGSSDACDRCLLYRGRKTGPLLALAEPAPAKLRLVVLINGILSSCVGELAAYLERDRVWASLELIRSVLLVMLFSHSIRRRGASELARNISPDAS
jgi:hypothetical protein